MAKPDVAPAILAELAPNGTLRAGINLSNFLLVTGKAPNGDPVGVSPDMATEIATRLGVSIQYVLYPDPGSLADAAEKGEWDIGNIGAEPQRAKTIAFSGKRPVEARFQAFSGCQFHGMSSSMRLIL